MGLIELFKDFHSQAVEGEYPASVRALYNFFLGELNARYWTTDELSYSERELATLAGLPKSTIHTSMKFLCDRGFIKTSRGKIKTKTLIKILPACSQVGQTPGSCWAVAGQLLGRFENPNYAHAKDVKDIKDIKTKEEERARERILPLSVNSAEVTQAWSACNGEELKGGRALQMVDLEKAYGTQALLTAIRKAYYSHDYERYGAKTRVAHVVAIVENSREGGKTDGKRANIVKPVEDPNRYGVDCTNQPRPPA